MILQVNISMLNSRKLINTVSGFRSLQDRIFVPALLHVLYHLPQIPNVENDEEAIHKVHLQFSFIFCISL